MTPGSIKPFSFATASQAGLGAATLSDFALPAKKKSGGTSYISRDRLAVQNAPAVSRTPSGRHFPENPTPIDHLKFLHGMDAERDLNVGLRRLGNKKSEGKFRNPQIKVSYASKVKVSELSKYIDLLQGEPDVYITQGDYAWWLRKKDPEWYKTNSNYLRGISSIFVDLDVYHSPLWKDAPTVDVVNAILAKCDAAGVPRPLVINSGRGLYTIWGLTSRVPVKEYGGQWQKVQSRLLLLLEEFGADTVVKDMTRVLRLVGSYNSKAQTCVSVAFDDGMRYSLAHMDECTAGLPVPVPKEKPKKSKVAQKQVAAESKDAKVKRTTPPKAPSELAICAPPELNATAQAILDAQLAWLVRYVEYGDACVSRFGKMRKGAFAIFKDIATLVLLRGGIPTGMRDVTQMWMAIYLFFAGFITADDLPAMAKNFSLLCHEPLDIYQSGEARSLMDRMNQHRDMFGYLSDSSEPKHKRMLTKRTGCIGLNPVTPKAPDERRVRTSFDSYMGSPVYKAKISTLIEVLGITEQEQAYLTRLIGPEERARRKWLKGARHKKIGRNAEMLRLYQEGESPKHLSETFEVSPATVYRVLHTDDVTHAQSMSTRAALRQHRFEKKRATLSVYLLDQSMSVRQLAKNAGVSPSFAHRVVCEFKEKQAIERKARIFVSLSGLNPYAKSSVTSNDVLAGPALGPQIPAVSSSKPVVLPAVSPFSFSPEDNRGRTYGLGAKTVGDGKRAMGGDRASVSWSLDRSLVDSLLAFSHTRSPGSPQNSPHGALDAAPDALCPDSLVSAADPSAAGFTPVSPGTGSLAEYLAQVRAQRLNREEACVIDPTSPQANLFSSMPGIDHSRLVKKSKKGSSMIVGKALSLHGTQSVPPNLAVASGPLAMSTDPQASMEATSDEVDPWELVSDADHDENPFEGIGVEGEFIGQDDEDDDPFDSSWYRDEGGDVCTGEYDTAEVDQVTVQNDIPGNPGIAQGAVQMPGDYGTEPSEVAGMNVDENGYPLDLDSLKVMVLDGGIQDNWNHDERRKFESLVKECQADWTMTTFSMRKLKARLLRADMCAILMQYYEMAEPLVVNQERPNVA